MVNFFWIFQNADLRKQLANIQNELQEAVQQRESAILKEETARKEFLDQVKLAAEVNISFSYECRNFTRRFVYKGRACVLQLIYDCCAS